MNHFINQTRALDMSEVPEHCFGGTEGSSNLGRVWFVAYGATPRHTSCAAGVAP